MASLDQAAVSIDSTFAGSEILVFGAITREAPAGDAAIDVIVTVAGPPGPELVRRKARRGGIWVNVEAAEIDAAPSFYAVATTGPLDLILRQTDDLRHAITVRRAIRAVATGAEDGQAFVEALIRVREAAGTYRLSEGAVELIEGTLFRAEVALPSNLTEGAYTTRIYLTRGGEVIASYATALDVRKVGLERFLHGLANDQPVLYGLLAVAIAVLAGWGASAVFGLLRR